MASDLKSLAHKDWPYAGSPHEWRGFVRGGVEAKNTRVEPAMSMYLTKEEFQAARAVYQKQKFGPELK